MIVGFFVGMIFAITLIMTIQEMYDWFDILQDKYNSPSFIDAEKDEFLEDSMWNIINTTIDNLEADNASIERIKTLVTPATASTSISGLLTLTSDTSVALLSISLASTGKPLKRLTYNQAQKAEDNTYKKGTAASPNFTTVVGGYQTLPALNAVSLDYVYIAVPTAIDDLPIAMHRKQVAGAMVKTGLVTEAEALTMMDKVTNG